MGDLLATLPSIVDADGARCGPHRLLDPPNDPVECREEVAGVLLGEVLDSGYVSLGDDQGVTRGRGVDIEEGQSLLVLVDLVEWDPPPDDSAKDAAVSQSRVTSSRARCSRPVPFRPQS